MDAQHLDPALRLVGGERFGDRAVPFEGARQRERVLERELRSRADGEVGGVRGVAHQHDVAVDPRGVVHARELQPIPAAQVRGVGQKCVSVEPRCEQLLAKRERRVRVGAVEARGAPRFVAHLDDEGRRVAIEAVGVRPHPAVRRRDEDEGEGIEEPVRAEPDEAVAAQLDLRAEGRRAALADAAVDAVGGDDQVGAREAGQVVDFALEREFDAQFARAMLQDLEQFLARDSREPVPARTQDAPFEMDVDVVPVGELLDDARFGRGIASPQIL